MAMKDRNILIVDDEESMRELLTAVLEEEGYITKAVSRGEEALEEVGKGDFDLVIMDMKLPRMSGIEALQEIKEIKSELTVVLITAYASVDSAVKAMKLGAYDYLTKPFDVDELKMLVEKIFERRNLIEENIYLKQELKGRYEFHNIIGQSAKMQEVFNLIDMVAPTVANVIIYGESGTGKELIARAIHEHSPRKDKPFVTVNCTAIPENLLESELFGHEKGSFTGATSRREGKFKLADGGTIFLDEIGEMSLAMQPKLLRVLQERKFERVGGTEVIEVDVRLVAATNKNLEEAVKEGKFREDLFYRLDVVPIHLPPLRERKEDIPLLAEHFLEKYNRLNSRQIRKISPEAMGLLVNYHWPGNIRELENTIERAVIIARGETILPEYLPLSVQSSSRKKSENELEVGMSLKEAEGLLIQKTLEEVGGNKSQAAKVLGITRQTLRNKMREYGLDG